VFSPLTPPPRQKFLDAFLGAAKIEHIMPKVEIISEGDQVNEVRPAWLDRFVMRA
jgi:hypothetical protein